MKKRQYTTILLLFMAMLSWAAKAPTDEQLKAFCRQVSSMIGSKETGEAKQQVFMDEARKLEKETDISSLTASQVEMLFDFGGIALDSYLRLWLEPTLENRAKTESVFAFYRWKYMPENDGFMHNAKETAALIAFLQKKDLQKALTDNEDIALDIINAMATMKDANWHTDGFSQGMMRLMECNLNDKAVLECVKVFNSVARVDTFDTAIREKFRSICRNKYSTLASTIDSPRKIKACKEQIKYLDGPFACGTLVGGKAPELHLMKVMQQQGDSVAIINASSLDAFKGKVVMLDFWGTKCVPCLQSFPELAEMQKHFEGKDVVILGVTSLQGYFVDTPNKRTIQCRNNKEKELSLFPDYMKGMGITWTIGISEEDVMNTDYGALAIPHVTVIDKDGIVRHNAVNGDKEMKIKLIEDLLNK